MTIVPDAATDEFLVVASEALSTTGGAAALDALDFWDLLPELDDLTARLAVFSVFRAQGRELGSSPALGALMAQPYAELGIDPRETLVAQTRSSRRRGEVVLAIGEVSGRNLLLDRPDNSLVVVAAERARLRPAELPGLLEIHEVSLDDATPVEADPAVVARARERSVTLGRLALSSEILGAAEGAVELAIDYAKQRTQFGQPIGTFQAVRHMLAWARTDCVALAAVIRQALLLDQLAHDRYDEITKALAGRNSRLACERSLQALGGIGFTAEHRHHHHHSRALFLDGLLGTSAELTHALGTWLRTAEAFPELARHALFVTDE